MQSLTMIAAVAALAVMPAASPAPHADRQDPQAPEGGSEIPKIVDLQRVSGPTPFADDCGDPNDQGTGIPGFEAEPQLSVRPRDPDHLLATWQQDRYSGIGGARSNLVAVSRDGGRSWSSPTTLPGMSACTGGERFRASDPWGAIGPEGVAYQASMPVTELLSFEPRTDPPPVRFDADIVVSRSPDGGTDWNEPAVVARDEGLHWNEKPVVAADPSRPGHAYVVWARHVVADPGPVFAPGDVHMAFSRTEDGGMTFTEPTTIPPNVPGVPDWPWIVLAVPGDDGPTLVVLYTHFPQRVVFNPNVLAAVTSDDLGATWSDPSVLAIGSELGIPSAAVGPSGEIHTTWFERAPDGTSQIRAARSSDRGATWTTNTVADLGSNVVGESAVPTIAVDGDGTVGVTWYDSRNDVSGDDEVTTDVFFAWSRDRGNSWRQRHLAGPFDLDAAAVTEGGRRFLGDYEGLVGFRHGFGALFSMARPQATSGPTDIFYARIVLPPRGMAHGPPARPSTMAAAADADVGAARDAPASCEWPYVFPPQPHDCELSENPFDEPSDGDEFESEPSSSSGGTQAPPPTTSATPPVERSEADDPTQAPTAPATATTSRSETLMDDDAASHAPSMGTRDGPTDRAVQPVMAPDPPAPVLGSGTDPTPDHMILAVVLVAAVLGGVALVSAVGGSRRVR